MSERKRAWMIAGSIVSYAVAVTMAVFEIVLLAALYDWYGVQALAGGPPSVDGALGTLLMFLFPVTLLALPGLVLTSRLRHARATARPQRSVPV